MLKVVIYWVLALGCFAGMWFANIYLVVDPNVLSITVGMLGVGVGLFASQASSAKNERQLERILTAALIIEKEEEAKSAEDAKLLYEREIARLKEVIEQEGNLLLLKRMREVYIDEAKAKLREIDSIQNSLVNLENAERSTEVEKVRAKLEGLLRNVSNPEEDDRLIRQFCYSLPLFGNAIYFVYSVWKKVDPTIQDRIHRRLNAMTLTRGRSGIFLKVVSFVAIAIFIIGLVYVLATIFSNFFLRNLAF